MELNTLIGKRVELQLFDADAGYRESRESNYSPTPMPKVFGTVVGVRDDDRKSYWKEYIVRLDKLLSFDFAEVEQPYRSIRTEYLLLTTPHIKDNENRDAIKDSILHQSGINVFIGPISSRDVDSFSNISDFDQTAPAIFDARVMMA